MNKENIGKALCGNKIKVVQFQPNPIFAMLWCPALQTDASSSVREQRTWTLLEVDIILEYPESVQTVYAVLLAGAENLEFFDYMLSL